MRRPAHMRELIDMIIDKAMDDYDDVNLAAWELRDELERLEGGGIRSARVVLDDATIDGLKGMIRQRVRQSAKLAVGDKEMPTHYAIDGTSVRWIDAPTRKLGQKIRRLTSEAVSRLEHARVLEQGHELAIEHGVETAAEAFAAEGIVVTEIAS